MAHADGQREAEQGSIPNIILIMRDNRMNSRENIELHGLLCSSKSRSTCAPLTPHAWWGTSGNVHSLFFFASLIRPRSRTEFCRLSVPVLYILSLLLVVPPCSDVYSTATTYHQDPDLGFLAFFFNVIHDVNNRTINTADAKPILG